MQNKMLSFKKITIEDYDILKKYLDESEQNSCESSFVNLMIWQKAYNNMYAVSKGQLIIKSGKDEDLVFQLPFGDDFELGMELIEEYCGGKSYGLYLQEGKRLEKFLKSKKSKNYEINEYRDAFDYIYLRENLANLSGKKYHSKRNHISAFSKKWEWRYETLSESNIEKVKKCAEKWYEQRNYTADKYLPIEKRGLESILENMEVLGVRGGVILVKDEAVAFTLGSPINDEVFDVHIEKALPEYDTAYTVINNQFVKNELEEFKYVNREDDMGLEGLRKAKLSYKPDILLKKYFCTAR